MQIYFDLDGTLIDIKHKHFKIYQDVIKDLGGKPLDKEKYWTLKRNKTEINQILKKSLIPDNKIGIFQKKFTKKIESKKYLVFDKLFPYTLTTLNLLLNYKHDLRLVSYRRHKQNTIQEIYSLGLFDKFNQIKIGKLGNDGSKTKKIFINRMSNDNSHKILIGDTEDDILAAKYLGMISVGILSGIRNEKILKQYKPDYILKSIKSLPSVINLLKV